MWLLGPEGREQIRDLGRFGAVGTELVVASLLGYFGGRWLDGQWDTDPWFRLIGFFLGLVAGSKSLYVLARQYKSDLADTDRDRSD